MKKKVISTFLLGSLCISGLSFTPQIQANESFDEIPFEVNSYEENTLPVIDEEEVIVTPEQAIKLLMENKGMGYGEAKTLLTNSSASPKYKTLASQNTKIVYVNRTKTYDAGAGAQVEIGALLEVEISYDWGTKRILSTKEKWISIKGNNTATFQQDYISDLTRSYPTQDVVLKGRGTVTHAVSYSMGASLEASLKRLGFSLDGSFGNTKYYRKTIDLDFVARYH